MSEESSIELKSVEGISQSRLVFRRFVGHKAAMIALGVFILIILLSITSIGWGIVPGWWKYDYSSTSAVEGIGAPSENHPFGQNNIGIDMFAMTMRGIQQSLTVMFLMGFVSTIIGVIVGAIAGYFRGAADTFLMRGADVFIVVPTLIVGAVLGKVFHGTTAVSLGIVFGFIVWMSMARLVRAEFLSLREREFVDAAKIAGASSVRIIFSHILPNTIGVIIVNATLLLSSSILLETSLSYLGFGIQYPDVSLGNIISENQNAFQTRPWLFWWPGLFIVAIALCANFIGDGLRDAFDPKQKKIPSQAKMLKALLVRDGGSGSSDSTGSGSGGLGSGSGSAGSYGSGSASSYDAPSYGSGSGGFGGMGIVSEGIGSISADVETTDEGVQND
jgi:peptide/nickel transport system permease protein